MQMGDDDEDDDDDDDDDGGDGGGGGGDDDHRENRWQHFQDCSTMWEHSSVFTLQAGTSR